MAADRRRWRVTEPMARTILVGGVLFTTTIFVAVATSLDALVPAAIVLFAGYLLVTGDARTPLQSGEGSGPTVRHAIHELVVYCGIVPGGCFVVQLVAFPVGLALLPAIESLPVAPLADAASEIRRWWNGLWFRYVAFLVTFAYALIAGVLALAVRAVREYGQRETVR